MNTHDPFDPKFLHPWTRYLGLVTLVSGAAFFTVIQLPLPQTPGLLIGGLAFVGLVLGGALFLYNLAKVVSVKLKGRQRTRFQVAVALIVPLAFVCILSPRVDALPFATLSQIILTPWLLVPLGIIGSMGWLAGKELNRDHPFRGFLLAAVILFVLCWMWNSGMTSESDRDDEGTARWFMDPKGEAAKAEAKATVEFVYRYVLYVLAAYTGLFLGFLWRGSKVGRREAFGELYAALTPATVKDIVSKMGGYIANRRARYGRVADLPFPKIVIEMAFIKAIRDCTDPKMRELLKGLYITLDDYMLNDEDCAIVNAHHDLIRHGASIQQDTPESIMALAKKLASPEMRRGVEIQHRLADAVNRRSALLESLSL